MTLPPGVTALPHLSPTCQRAMHCCETAAHEATARGYPGGRIAHRCPQIYAATNAQCTRAMGEAAEALMQFGVRPPESCTPPGEGGRGRGDERDRDRGREEW